MTPLILAIESDYRQAAHLRSIIKHRVGAQLVLADTTERALDAIGNRVPDLVLVPALLSPQDDAALAQALRVIASAAHVQMLTIPVLAGPSPQPAAAKGGVLSSFLRERPRAASPEGCDPQVFADQIRSYLQQFAIEHEDHLADSDVPAPPVAAAPAHPALEAVASESIVVAPTATDPVVPESVVMDPVVVEPDFEPAAALEPVVPEPLAEEPPPAYEPPPAVFVEEPSPTAFAHLLHLFEEPAPPAPAPLAAAPPAPAPAPVQALDPDAFDKLIAELTPTELPRIEEVDVDAWAQEPQIAEQATEFEEEEEVVLQLDQPAEPESAAGGSTVSPEWVALIASLRQDLERRRTDPAPRPPQPRRRERPTPTQDEWGFFDPEQCGFAALLEKLEEITQ